MRAVIDTNVLLSGLIWHGTPHVLIEQVRTGALTLVSSPFLIAELAEVIGRPKFHTILGKSNIDPEMMLADIRRLAEIFRRRRSSRARQLCRYSHRQPSTGAHRNPLSRQWVGRAVQRIEGAVLF